MHVLKLIVPCALLLSVPGFASADTSNCASVPQSMPLRPSVLAPIASELSSPAEQIGNAGGVLAMAYDESQSVDQVLLRMKIESCKNVAKAMPAPSIVDPNDPATYKPKTQFDNTPWRFNMTQNGKSMTADEFDAWLKAKGVRVVRAPAAAVVPVATPPAATPSSNDGGKTAP